MNMDLLQLTHENFDITDEKCYSQLTTNNINIVINTAAYLGVEPCEENPIHAFEINTYAPGQLARFCNYNQMTLVQISTDNVFDGKKGNYDETSIPQPINLYGITKYSAELLVSNLCSNYYIFRIPILFGKRNNKGSIFIEKMHSLYLQGKKEINIADDIICKPSYSVDVAEKILDIVKSKKPFGTYHIFNGGEKASLFDFAKEFFSAKNINDLSLIRAKAEDFSYKEKALKPLNTTLNSVKTAALRDWKDALLEFAKKQT